MSNDVIVARLKTRADITVDSLEIPVTLGDVGLKGVEYQRDECALPALDVTSIGYRRNALDALTIIVYIPLYNQRLLHL